MQQQFQCINEHLLKLQVPPVHRTQTFSQITGTASSPYPNICSNYRNRQFTVPKHLLKLQVPPVHRTQTFSQITGTASSPYIWMLSTRSQLRKTHWQYIFVTSISFYLPVLRLLFISWHICIGNRKCISWGSNGKSCSYFMNILQCSKVAHLPCLNCSSSIYAEQ
jgi:hypothetical protein